MGFYFKQTSDTQDALLIQKKINTNELKFDESGIFYDNGYGEKFVYWVPLKNGNIPIILNGKVQTGILTQSGYNYIQRHISNSVS